MTNSAPRQLLGLTLPPEFLGDIISKRASADYSEPPRRAEFTSPAAWFYALKHHGVADDPDFPDIFKVRFVAVKVPGAAHGPDDILDLLFVLLGYYHWFSVYRATPVRHSTCSVLYRGRPPPSIRVSTYFLRSTTNWVLDLPDH